MKIISSAFLVLKFSFVTMQATFVSVRPNASPDANKLPGGCGIHVYFVFMAMYENYSPGFRQFLCTIFNVSLFIHSDHHTYALKLSEISENKHLHI